MPKGVKRPPSIVGEPRTCLNGCGRITDLVPAICQRCAYAARRSVDAMISASYSPTNIGVEPSFHGTLRRNPRGINGTKPKPFADDAM